MTSRPDGAPSRRPIRAAVALCTAVLAVLFVSQPASAHIKNEALKQRYLAGVSGQRSVMDSYVSTVDQARQTVEALTEQMDAVVPPVQPGDFETARQIALSAKSQHDIHEPWHSSSLEQTPEDVAQWAKHARTCFRSAAEKKALKRRADALVAGFGMLMKADGDLLDAMVRLTEQDVGAAQGDLMAASQHRIQAIKMIDAALEALKKLA